MAWLTFSIVYFVMGLAVAGFTLGVFPPFETYRPPLRWRFAALLTYVSLWPFLVMIAFGYFLGNRRQFRFESQRRTFPPSSIRANRLGRRPVSQDLSHRGIRFQAIYEDTRN